jgi:5-methylcytosine-specific restriction endonuclease McrA
MQNLQLLCSECNLGKQDLISWHLGVPYQDRSPSKKLRYVVLARAGGRCATPTCTRTSAQDELKLATRVSRSVGGRWVFDNLRALCAAHLRQLEAERLARTRRALAQRNSGRVVRISS